MREGKKHTRFAQVLDLIFHSANVAEMTEVLAGGSRQCELTFAP